MSRRPSGYGFLVGTLGGIAAVAGSYAASGYSSAFVFAPVDSFVTDNTPAAVLRFAIEELGDAGHLLAAGLALGLTVAAFAVLAAGGRSVAAAYGPLPGGALAGIAAWSLATALTNTPVRALGAAVPAALVVGVSAVSLPAGASPDDARRRVLGLAAGVVAFAGVATAAGRRQSPSVGGDPLDGDGTVGELLAEADRKSLDVPGLEPLVSESFYEVDINNVNPTVEAADWSLSVTGAVEDERSIDYADLRAMDAERRFVTLRCVGESLNGRKMDTALWTVVPVADLVDEAGPQGGCECVMVRAADDYYEEFPLAALRTGYLAYGMNGETLPRAHGFPVRLLVPGHWGEINVKWVTEIEVLEREADGYWEERGWHGTGPVNTVAKLWTTDRREDGTVAVAGHAYAGTRGVDRVEVSVDGEQSWTDATLSEPLPGEDVWRQWVHEFEPDGSHEVVVRAVDGEGRVQTEERSDPSPSGATGWVRTTVEER